MRAAHAKTSMHRRLDAMTRRVGLAVAALVLAPACEDRTSAEDAIFASPAGIAVAGAALDKLFVANTGEDSLQVVRLGERLRDIALVRSSALYFPLQIPAGMHPTRLAATPDGRYVVALAQAEETLALIDADALAAVQDETGAPMRVPLGAVGSAPADLVASPVACAAPCAGRFHVALAHTGSVLTLEVVTDPVASLAIVGGFAVGGTPSRLAISPDGRALFVADGHEARVTRIALDSGATESLDTGAIPGPLAVSTDGNLLLVGRPALRDVLVVSGASRGGLVPAPTNPVFTPAPRCLAECGATDACTGAHPADASLCVGAAGLEATTNPYRALYVGAAPAVIAVVGRGAGHAPLAVECDDDDTTAQPVKSYDEFAIVATHDNAAAGNLLFVGLAGEGVTGPELVNDRWCGQARLTQPEGAVTATGTEAPALSEVLESCPATPADTARLVCAKVEDGDAGVAVFPGNLIATEQDGRSGYALEWEAVLPGLRREQGGGVILADGRFKDLGIDLADYEIQPRQTDGNGATTYAGDILEIRTAPRRSDPACAAALADLPQRLCIFERRILAVVDHDGAGALVLDAALPDACFQQGGAIAYRVRAGDQFLVRPPTGASLRLAPGGRFGPGGDVGQRQPIAFVAKALDPQTALGACERFDDDGDAVDPMPAALSRNREIAFIVDGAFAPVRSGLEVAINQRTGGALGVGPADMLVLPPAAKSVATTESGARSPIFVTYQGSNTLLGVLPYELGLTTDSRFGTSVYAILR